MFHTPIGLLALAAVPAVVALHLFRRRFRPQQVSALFLWRRYDESVRTGRTLERLHRSPSFWCEVLAALLLGLTLGGPRACGSGEVPHLVLVLDTSASMGARGADGATFRERALAIAAERIGRLPSRSRVTVVASGRSPELLAGPAALPGRAADALAAYAADRLGHDLARSVAFALELAGDGAVLVLSDGERPEGYSDALEWIGVGEPVANLALSRVSRARVGEGGAERVFATVRNFSERARTVRGTVTEMDAASAGEAGTVLGRFELDVDAGGAASAAIDLVPGAGDVEIALEPDALATDNRALLVPDERRVVRLRCDLDPELAHRLGLAPPEADPGGAARLASALPDVQLVRPGAAAHVVLAGAPCLESGPLGRGTWTLVLPTLGSEREDYGGPFLREVRHPALRGVTLEGSVWSADPNVELPGRTLASAGELPLISEAARGAGDAAPQDLWLNLDPWRSSLHRSPDWPILIANLVERRRALLPGPRAVNLLVGEEYERRGALLASASLDPAARADFRLRGPGGLARDVPFAEPLVVGGLTRPGLYRLERAGEEVSRFAVHFADPAESDLRDRSSAVGEARGTLATVRSDLGWLETVLLSGVALLLLVDWLVLAGWRRIFGGQRLLGGREAT